MLIFFGPAGAGKSVQGQLLAKSHNYDWVSTGEILRNSDDPKIKMAMSNGKLLNDELVESVVENILKYKAVKALILDGFPRNEPQAAWLLGYLKQRGDKIEAVVNIQIDNSTNERRLLKRGRTDDTEAAIAARRHEYESITMPTLSYLHQQNVPVLDIDGIGTVEEVHERIVKALIG